MGRYLDLIGVPGDETANPSRRDKSDISDESHARVEHGAETRAHGGVLSLSSLMSHSNPSSAPTTLVEPSDPAFWRDLFEERAAIRQFDGGYSRAAAESLAWGELQNRWHLAHGKRVPSELCAGCRRSIGEAPALDLIDRCRVHDADGHACLIRWGELWRTAASRFLIAMGLRPPTGDHPP
jgi:hypothetical protein